MKKSIGSSYCIDQSPGSERIGGLTVTLRARTGASGTIKVVPNSRLTGETLEDIEPYIAEAERGLRECAQHFGVNLDDLDVVISDFVYHPVDSFGRFYYGAAKSAFRSAWDGWTKYCEIPS